MQQCTQNKGVDLRNTQTHWGLICLYRNATLSIKEASKVRPSTRESVSGGLVCPCLPECQFVCHFKPNLCGYSPFFCFSSNTELSLLHRWKTAENSRSLLCRMPACDPFQACRAKTTGVIVPIYGTTQPISKTDQNVSPLDRLTKTETQCTVSFANRNAAVPIKVPTKILKLLLRRAPFRHSRCQRKLIYLAMSLKRLNLWALHPSQQALQAIATSLPSLQAGSAEKRSACPTKTGHDIRWTSAQREPLRQLPCHDHGCQELRMGLIRVATFGHHANIPILLDAARWVELEYMFKLTATNSTKYIHPNQPNPNSTATTFIIGVFFRKGCLKIYSTTWPSCSIYSNSVRQICHHVVYPMTSLSWYLKFSVCGT